jgi:hypothetical protein
VNFSTLHCHLSLYWKLSVSAHLHQTFTIQLPCSCDAVLRAQIHVRFGGNHSYPPTHTTFSPEFFVDCWLVKSHEVHTVVVVSADASGFEKECRSPEQWGGGAVSRLSAIACGGGKIGKNYQLPEKHKSHSGGVGNAKNSHLGAVEMKFGRWSSSQGQTKA